MQLHNLNEMVKVALYFAFACFSIVLFPACEAATTKTPPLCARCLPRTLILTPSDGTPGSITPVIKMLPNTPQGCRQMNVICTTPAGYTTSNMVFNGSGAPKTGKNVTALIPELREVLCKLNVLCDNGKSEHY
ncbi:hypothetical protein ANCCEY_05405 [Ancylostoma ceylanicum]|uniref:C6 domain-containing protein n=1 Tax=Ancylostoma ceylanicum TaxID=53326 RepID=A0A0D6LUG1_9BILA|nr:hypothetical protein ANCCEY_05405 [Ancylostoma ceylanicum]